MSDLVERLGPDLLLSFNEEAERDRNLPQRLHRLHAVGEPGQAARDPVPGRLHRVQTVVRDAGEGAELHQVVDEAPRILYDIAVDGAGGDHRAILTLGVWTLPNSISRHARTEL